MEKRTKPLKIGLLGMILTGVIGYSGAFVSSRFCNHYAERYQETKSVEDLGKAKLYYNIGIYSLIGTGITVSGFALSSLGAQVYGDIKGRRKNES